MAGPLDVRESFPTTETGAGVGVAKTSVVPGQATAGVNADVGFAFQDQNGNAVLPQLDKFGRVSVSTEIEGLRLRARAVEPGQVLSATGASYSNFVTLASISGVSGTVADMKGSVACRKGALFQLVYQDNGAVLVLDEVIVDSGQYTAPIGIDGDEFNVPVSGVSPQFLIRGGNFSVASDLHSMLKVVQF